MRASVLLLVITTATTPILAINFPSSNPSSNSQGRLVFNRQTFSTASCAASGETVTTVSLNTGEGRVFQSANYPANYPDGQSCTYNFQPAAGNQLVFSCSDYDLKATSSVGDLCTGDYLRFYDENGVLGQSGTRYCHTTAPAFTYTTNINVLFKTNNESQVDIVQLSSRNIETCHNNFHSLVVRPGHDGCTESNEAAPALSYFIGFIV